VVQVSAVYLTLAAATLGAALAELRHWYTGRRRARTANQHYVLNGWKP
jgi:hypothetical protein